MLLAIDVGNTNTVFTVHNGEHFVAEWRLRTDGRRTADEYFAWLNQLMIHEQFGRKLIDGIVIASVAPQTLFNLRGLAKKYFDCEPVVVGEPGVDLGVEVRSEHPAEVGADRIVNTLAGFESYGPNLILVDFGTATTFDVVDQDGAYAGGVIAPGVNLAAEALYQAASALPRISIERPPQVVGVNTVQCMQSGMYWGYIGLIEGICRRINSERGVEMTVIATGGLSPLFAEGSEVIKQADPDLTMRGLVSIFRRNAGRSNGRD
ncbi:MAG: type III pantothenate kinase [Rhodobacteraceae bacterium]|nr:type III pantothenate kinase [Paracoccaceae bacterium]